MIALDAPVMRVERLGASTSAFGNHHPTCQTDVFGLRSGMAPVHDAEWAS